MKIRATSSKGEVTFTVGAESDVDSALMGVFLRRAYEDHTRWKLRIGGWTPPGSGNPPAPGSFNFDWVEMPTPDEHVAQLLRQLAEERARTKKKCGVLEDLRQKLRALADDD